MDMGVVHPPEAPVPLPGAARAGGHAPGVSGVIVPRCPVKFVYPILRIT